MRRVVAAGALVAAVALAATAGSANGATPTEKKLTRQVAALQKDVAALKKSVTEANDAASAAIVLGFCTAALAADGLQSTWGVVDQKTGGTPIGAQQTVNDSGACNALEVPRSQAVPPSLAPFHSLMNLLTFRSIFGALGPFGLPLR